jgi:UDP-2,3-diacylglucosamine pyrophosphatase LpxH
MRNIFIISDLHLGGEYALKRAPGQRGFRLCTCPKAIADFVGRLGARIAEEGPNELVLNGDTVDFLAELEDGKPGSWSPFTASPERAVAKLQQIVERDACVFKAFGDYLAAGGRLTVLLGNHDIELSLPLVREALRKAIGVKKGHDFNFIYDGEAYTIGNALIEHGNRYDAWNQVDYDGLRRLRSVQSRRQTPFEKKPFVAPPGSRMVTSVVNEIKSDYPFVDLLKPETTAMVPLLLALEPGYRGRLGAIALLYYATFSHGLSEPDKPTFAGDISNVGSADDVDQTVGHDISDAPDSNNDISDWDNDVADDELFDSSDADEALKKLLRDVLGKDTDKFLVGLSEHLPEAESGNEPVGVDISMMDGVNRAWGFIRLLVSKRSTSVEKRLPSLQRALRGLQDDKSFDQSTETLTEYLEAAKRIAGRGFKYVIFGHTHQPKRVALENACFYLNSGTWADVLQLPPGMISGKSRKFDAEATAPMKNFIEQIKKKDFSPWTPFNPTYVHLRVDENDRVSSATLEKFQWPPPKADDTRDSKPEHG